MHKASAPADIGFNADIDHNACMQNDNPPSTTALTIRNVDRTLREQLRRRAGRYGLSMEAELRQILGDTLAAERSSEMNLAEAIRRRIEPLGGVDLEPHPPVPVGDPPSFDR